MVPEDAYSSKVKFKEECDCKYDGLWGQFCETRVECSCINQCSGHGHCRGGFCKVCFRDLMKWNNFVKFNILMWCVVLCFSTSVSCNLIQYLLQCDSGYFGIDCSIPSAYSLAYDWPSWLQTPVNLPDLKTLNSTTIGVKAVVQKRRPLIYVYDLPAEFDSHLLEVSLCHTCSFLCS